MTTREEKLETLGQRLRFARKDRHFKQAVDFARSIGMEDQRYINHENGQRTPKLPELKKYAKALKINLSWLVDGDGDMQQTGNRHEPAAEKKVGFAEPDQAPAEHGGKLDPIDEAEKLRGLIINGCRGLSPEAREEFDLDAVMKMMQRIFHKEKTVAEAKKNRKA